MNASKNQKYKCALCHTLHSRAHTPCVKCAKPAHPADVAAEEQMIVAIRNADCFLASLFVGRGEYKKIGAPTVLGALCAAQLLESAHATATRRAIIYAVGADNSATMITYKLIEELRQLATIGKSDVI